MQSSSFIDRRVAALGVLWIAAVVAGFAVLTHHQLAPGRPAEAPQLWPQESALAAPDQEPVLLLFAHPRCPCTRATLSELARLSSRAERPFRTHVLFLRPEGYSEDWTRTDLWNSAAAIPGVEPRIDDEGAEAHRFGSYTSGQVLLYGAEGELLFSGGITSSRGHEGDNAGRAALQKLLAGSPTETDEVRVFGCALHEEDDSCTDGRCDIDRS